MENMTVKDLLAATGGKLLSGMPSEPLGNISIDSRTLEQGDFFFALKGKNFNGHNYLHEAATKGAAGMVVSESGDRADERNKARAVILVKDTTLALGDLAAYYRKKWAIPLIAITGSNGKTTTKQMLASILGLKGKTLSNHGNFNNQIGLPLSLLKLTGEHKYAVMELGTSLPGEIGRLGAISQPDIGVITNIGYSHLEGLKDRDGVFKEKKTLFNNLKKGGCAVFNGDDQYLKTLGSELKVEKLTFGMDRKNDVSADKVQPVAGGVAFSLFMAGRTIPVKLPVYGAFNVYNAMAAASAAKKLGIELEVIKKGLETFSAVKMRMEPFRLASGALLINDAYNSNPSSVKESVKSFVEAFPAKTKIAVLGDMLELGERSAEFHKELGRFLAGQPLNKIFLVGPLMKNAFSALSGGIAVYFENKDGLAEQLKQELTKDSAVLFKGSRGMALEDLIKKLL